jgi:hypothetical protein
MLQCLGVEKKLVKVPYCDRLDVCNLPRNFTPQNLDSKLSSKATGPI